jgi:hypothetical protein
MDSKQQQSSQSVATSSSSPIIKDQLDEFVLSRSFINDTFISSLMTKALNLGFSFETTKEAFKEFLSQHLASTGKQCTPTVLNSLVSDFKLIFNEEKFIEKTLFMSIQVENMNASKSNWSEQNSDNESPANELATEQTGLNVKAEEYFFPGGSAALSSIVGNTSSEFQSDSSRQMQMFLQHQQQQQRMNAAAAQAAMAASAAQFAAIKQQQEQASIKHKALQDFYEKSVSRLNDKTNLRPIVIDGNDVGTPTNTTKQVFSFCRIRKVVEFFEKRQHSIYVILPNWRKEQIMAPQANPMPGMQQLNPAQLQAEQDALKEMEDKNIVHFTPSKRVGSKHIKTDDDSFIIQLAVLKQAIIVSNDNFKRFLNQSDELKHVVEERVLMYSFIDDTFMPADDPLGKFDFIIK